ncbi:MAG: NAD(+)/NADH kinase [Myxococcota bacterium]|nr:NAD(+)/NADH kinase [Myxococcota bacterium]MDW8361271.1 NAD(+)/NADH kinase [Myxococcales bacterium]
MKRPSVLLVAKEPVTPSTRRGDVEPALRAWLERQRLDALEHAATLRLVLTTLRRHRARVCVATLRRVPSGAFDLVVTVGGDGTLLGTSHHVTAGTPVLAVRSTPLGSVGHFCAADRREAADAISDALSGRLPAVALQRMRVKLDGRRLSNRVLNDVLFAHASAAAAARYVLSVGERSEEQRSSGLWVGPAAGSTAAQRSAGGRVLPVRSRRLQWVVREPYQGPGVSAPVLRRGTVGPEERVRVVSLMDAARVWIDGPHRSHRVVFGGRLEMELGDEPLTLLGLRRT